MQNTVKQYKAILAKRNALSHAMGVLSYDSETAMPKNGAPHMAETMAILSEESYKLQVNDEVRALLEKLNANSESLDEITRREVEEELKQLKKLENVPIEEYAAYSRLISAPASAVLRAISSAEITTLFILSSFSHLSPTAFIFIFPLHL